MNISTRLSVGGLVSVAVVAGIVAIVISATRNVRREIAENEAASEILDAATGIRYLTFDYALHREARAKVQWYSRHRSLAELLDRSQSVFDAGDRDVLKRLRETNDTVAELFQELAANRPGPLADADERVVAEEFEEGVSSQIVVRLETMIGDALGLSEASRARLLVAQWRATITVVTLGALIVVVIGAATVAAIRSVGRPLGALQEGTAIIGEGDLEHRLAVTSRDEFGALARAFNAMAGKLQKDRVDRLAAQAALEQTQADLAHVARVATLGELTAAIAHEVNQPLGAIVNNANAGLRWLAADNLNMAGASIALIVEDGHRASEILARIREMVRKTPPRKQPVDLNDAIREVVFLATSQAERCGVSIDSMLCGGLPRVHADRIQVQQVVLNLLVNAFEAMTDTAIGLRSVTVMSRRVEGDMLEISVSDRGAGIDGARLDRLFDAFYTTKASGLGMGLAICRAIVEDHGGLIRATLNQEGGATFRFTMPVAGDNGA